MREVPYFPRDPISLGPIENLTWKNYGRASESTDEHIKALQGVYEKPKTTAIYS